MESDKPQNNGQHNIARHPPVKHPPAQHAPREVIEEIVRLQTRKNLYSFLQKSFSIATPGAKFLPNWHLEMICDALSLCAEGKIKRLIINIPPRYLKSFCVSVAFPAWLLGNKPSQRIIVSSYSQALSTKHAADCRAIMKSQWYKETFPSSGIMLGQDTKNRFATSQRGYYFATSIGGTLLGDGGNVLIVDDPQTPMATLSKPQREGVINWFQTSLMSRLDDKQAGSIIIVMQRLHPQDLSGHLIEQEPQLWQNISFPAISQEECEVIFNNKTYHHRKEGEALHPQREEVEELMSLAGTIGTYAFQAQYQQSPILNEGGLIKQSWLTYYNQGASQTPLWDSVYLSIDCAKGIGQTSDYSVISVIGSNKQGDHFLIDVQRGRHQYPQLRRLTISTISQYKPAAVLIEDASNGSSLIQDLKFEGHQGIVPIKPKTDKVSRFNHALIAIESGRFLLPKKAPFLADFVSELMAFPASKHDDQVDTISQYFGWVYQRWPANRLLPKIRKI